MERLNGEGIPRRHLSIALGDRRQVLTARKIDRCLLCRRPRVNEAGLCDVCYSMLDGEELVLAGKWLTGAGP
jgi:hypothetical protein